MRKKTEQRGRRLLHFLLALAMALGLCQPVLVPAGVTTRYAVDTADESAVVDHTNETDTTETEDAIVSEDISEDTDNPEEINDSEGADDSAEDEAEEAADSAEDQAEGAADSAEDQTEGAADSAEDQAEGAADSAEDQAEGAADTIEGEADFAEDETEGAADAVEGSSDSAEGAADSIEEDAQNASDGADTAALSISLQGISTDGTSGSYVVASFDNTYDELVRVANAGVKITGTADDSTRDLTYNSNQTSHISYANAGEFIVSGTTISFYTSSLYEGENTVTFRNPDEGGTDLTVRLKMEREDEGWGRYSYTVTVLENDPPAEDPPAVDPPQEPDPAQDVLFVRLTGSFEHRIVGQEDPAPDSISSASVGGYTAADSEATVHVEYALAPAGTEQDNLADDAWKQPDYFTNGNEFQIDGTRSVVQMTEGSGMSCDLNPLNGDLTLTGVPTQAGVYKVSVLVTDALGRSALTNEVEFIVYSGNETLQAQLSDDSLFVQYQDGTRGFDMIPWYIHDFGTSDQSVTVPSDITVWYGSHGENPTPNYGELGETISLANGETPTQTLILPAGSNLTMVNLRVHSGVKIVVEKGAKLTLRSSIAEGIVDVYGTFSCDYSDYDKTWLHGSSVNGQIRMMDGSTLENARVISHANYSARDDENRRNFAPLITVQGSVTVSGDAYILGDEAPTGETGQPALSITDGSLTVPEGSVAAAYGGGTSFLTADGGSAIVMDKGSILGEGSLIAVGGFGMNITGDTSKGSGGSAVSGGGTIAVSKAYLEGGSSFQRPAKALSGSVAISETTSRKIVDGSAEQGNTYWKGTGDANGIIPDTQAVLALVPARVQAANPAGQRSISVSVDWQSANWPESVEKPQTINAVIKDKSGTPTATIALDAGNSWTKIISGLTDSEEYTVECSGLPNDCTVTQDSTDSTKWAPEQTGYLTAGKTYIITWKDNGQLFVLGAQDGVLGRAAWDGAMELPAGFQWKAIESEDRSGWYLTLAGDDQTGNAPFLTMTQDGTGAPTLRERNGADAYCALFAKEDGSLWNENIGRYFVIEKGSLATSDQTFTAFTFRQKLEQTDRFILTPKAPAQDPSPGNNENQDPSSPGNNGNQDPSSPGNNGNQDPSSPGNNGNQDPSSPGNKEDQPTGSEGNKDQKKSLAKASMTGITSKTYTGKPLTQLPSVRLGSVTLTRGTDYTLSYKNNVNAGTASVTATGRGKYTGSLTKTFTIKKSSQSLSLRAGSSLIVGNPLPAKGSGNKTTLSFKSSNTKIASVNSKGLVLGKAPGTVTITATAPGNKNYNSASKSVKIKVSYLSTPKITKVVNTRDGVKITLNGVKGAKKYRILYKTAGSGWKKAGDTVSKTFTWKKAKSGIKYTFTALCVTKDGKLTASKYNTKGTSLICLAAPDKPSVANTKAGTVNIKWKKIAGANGYQIQYSLKKSFPSGRKTITVTGAGKISKLVSSLSKSKTYFFRVRSYKTVSGKRMYSAWSLVNNVEQGDGSSYHSV